MSVTLFPANVKFNDGEGYHSIAAMAGRDLGITGASVGKVPVIASVDANGVPTSFTAGDGGSGASALVKVSDTQPTETENKLWVNTSGSSGNNYQVPTVAEMQTADALSAKADEIGIVIDGNQTAVGASAGQYVILRNSSITDKTDGLYTAAQTIPANTAIDGTYLTAVTGGGLNELKDILQFSGYITTVRPRQQNHIRLTFQENHPASVAIISAHAFCCVYSHDNGTWFQTSTSGTYKATKVSTYVTDVYVYEWVPVIIIATDNTVQVSIY